MVDGYGPSDIFRRPSAGRDPGITAKPSTSLATRTENPIGNSLLGLSQEIDKTADIFRQLTLQRQGAEDKTFVDVYELELNKKYGAIEQEMVNSPEAKKPDFVNRLDKRLADAQGETLDEIVSTGNYNPSKEGRDAAVRSAMSARTAAARRAAVAAHNQNVMGQVDGVSENVLSIAKVSALYGNLDDGIERAEKSVEGLRGILAPDKHETLRKAARQQVIESVVQGHIERGEFPQARMILDRNRGFAANSAERVIADAAQKSGVPAAYLVAVARIESAGNNNAKPKPDPVTGLQTSASGLFGFTAATGTSYGLPADASKASVEKQAAAAAALTSDNAKVLRKGLGGREPTPAELYLAHFLGADDAVKVLNAHPATPVEDVVQARSVASNTGILKNKTVGQVVGYANAKMMASGGGGAGYELDEQKRITLLNSIEIKEHQLTERTRAERQRVIKEYGENFLREAYNRSSAGTLDQGYIETIRPFVSPAEYHGLLKIMTKGAEADDQDAVIDLMNSADNMDPESFTKLANNHMDRHKLTTNTYISMVQRNRAAYKDDKPASPYKRATAFIKNYLDAGQLTGSASVPVANAARARAIMEFDSWIEANPKAQPHEILQEANSIARRAAIVQFDQMRNANPISKYFGAKTRSAVTIEDVVEAENRLAEEKDLGRVTAGQYAVEIGLLKNWREIIELEASRKAQEQANPPKRTGR